MHKIAAVTFGTLLRGNSALVEVDSLKHNLGAEPLHFRYLERIGHLWHKDRGRRAELPRSERYRLPVVSGRSRHHAARPYLGRELTEKIQSPANFERAGWLQVFALQKEPESESFGKRRRREKRSRGEVSRHDRARSKHILERWDGEARVVRGKWRQRPGRDLPRLQRHQPSSVRTSCRIRQSARCAGSPSFRAVSSRSNARKGHEIMHRSLVASQPSPRPRRHRHPTGADGGNRAQSTTLVPDGQPFLIVKDVNEQGVVVRGLADSALAPHKCDEHGNGNAEDPERAQDKTDNSDSAHGD